MLSSPDARGPRRGLEGSGGSAADVGAAEAEAHYHLIRLALYRARVLSGKPTSLTRLRELERTASRAEARARRVRKR